MNRRLDGEASGARPAVPGPSRTETGGGATDRRPQKARRTRRPGWRRDESGQALVELALVLPLVALLVGVAFDGWNSMQEAVRLTSAARAGVLVAANELGGATPPTQSQVLTDATAAVNAEEGDTNVFQSTDSGANDYVTMTTPSPVTTNGVTMNIVTITIHESSVNLVPFVGNLPVTTHATARYS
jgi:Flp pilus assembly protein TadG